MAADTPDLKSLFEALKAPPAPPKRESLKTCAIVMLVALGFGYYAGATHGFPEKKADAAVPVVLMSPAAPPAATPK